MSCGHAVTGRRGCAPPNATRTGGGHGGSGTARAGLHGLPRGIRAVRRLHLPHAGPPGGQPRRRGRPDYFWTIDDEYAALAREVPGGFGGLFWGEYEGRGEPGRLNFHLVDLSKEQAAIEALDGRGDHAIQGQYGYAQLKSCYDALRWEDPNLSIWQFEGLTVTDINEGLNRIVLGIKNLNTEPDLRALIHEIGVPQGMVVVEERQPPVIR